MSATSEEPAATVASRSALHVVVPAAMHDPSEPSGGNTYDRRLIEALTAQGQVVDEHAIPGTWPYPAPGEHSRLDDCLARIPAGAVVLLDGLVAGPSPTELLRHSGRLYVVIVVHLPLGEEARTTPGADPVPLEAGEGRAVRAAHAVITPSAWGARRVVELYGVAPHRVHVVAPGTDPAPVSEGTDGAHQLVCVASVTPVKGQDVLVDALATVREHPWSCRLLGSLQRAPRFVTHVRERRDRAGLTSRIQLGGACSDSELSQHYDTADLVLLGSRVESFGMVVGEALARGIPMVAPAVGGLPEAMGHAPDGSRPGLLVPAADARSLARALRRWFTGETLRHRLRTSALRRRDTLSGWQRAARGVVGVTEHVVRQKES